MNKNMMTIEEVAAYIGKSRNTVERLQASGKLSPMPREKQRAKRYFLKDDVDAYVAERNRTNPLKRPIVLRGIPTPTMITVPYNPNPDANAIAFYNEITRRANEITMTMKGIK